MQKLLISFISLFSAFSISIRTEGQQPVKFNHFTVENGLSSASVLSIAQDAKGFLWAGTMDGLNRYDGSSVKVFKAFYASNPLGSGLKINTLLAGDQDQVWIGTNNGLYLYNTGTGSFLAFFHDANSKKSISDSEIIKLYKNSKGEIWVCTRDGLNKVIAEDESFTFLRIQLGNDTTPRLNNIQDVIETVNGRMIAGTEGGLVAFSQSGKEARATNLTYLLQGKPVVSIAEDRQQNYWAGIRGEGLIQFNRRLAQIKQYSRESKHLPLVSNIIRKVYADSKGRIWVGTLKGLNLIYPDAEKIESYVNSPGDPGSLNFNSIYDIFEDRQGNIWVATFFGGLNYMEAVTTPFTVYCSNGTQKSVSSNIISAIVEDQKNNLWIGTEAEGVNYYDRRNKVFRWYSNNINDPGALSSNLVKALVLDKDNNVWVGLYNGGINVLNSSGHKVRAFGENKGENKINSDRVICLMLDHLNRMWIGTEEKGINIYDIKKGKISEFDSLYPGKKMSGKGITCLLEDSKNNIWIGTGHGLNMLEPAGNRLVDFSQSKNAQLQPDLINCLAEDANGVIWIGTHNGLASYDPVQKKFTSYSGNKGFTGNNVMGIVADDKNGLWISTDKGINLLDPARKKFYLFNTDDGLPGSVYNYRSFFKDTKGHLYFGGYKGLVTFDPRQIEMNLKAPEVVLTGLSVNGNVINTGDSSGILKNDISAIKELRLRHNQNVVTVQYAVMNFIRPLKNKSAYMLEDYNKAWVYPDAHNATFTNLPPGTYRLLIKAANNDGVWNNVPNILTIKILPPPWKTWWAYSMYALFILLLAAGIIYFFASRAALRRKIRYEHMINVKQQELHQMKMDFFTHISHEIRTPLTLIVGPAEMLTNSSSNNPAEKKMLVTIRNNAERLLKLTNDLLDFRKADSGHTKLNIKEVNITAFTQYVCDKFNGAASGKNINFNFESAENNIPVYLDPHYMEIVLSNLLSNAIKFTPEGGNISVKINHSKDGTVEIIVCDDGVGIPKESQEKIFTDFYQAEARSVKNAGSGIGLAFSKSLVELHKGKLSFKSEISPATGKQETCFIVTLLPGKDHFNGNNMTGNS